MKSQNAFIRITLILCINLFLLTACSKDEKAETKILSSALRSELEAATDKVFLETSTPGLIALVSVDGEPDFLIKRGVANLQTNEPIHEKNAFRIASITKTFTGTALLILADEGLIDLDASIDSYLPEFNIPSGDAISLRMLANMTSGLFDYSNDPGMWESFTGSGYTMEFTPDSLVRIALSYPPVGIPGAAYIYCNTNTVLLGLLMEKITGKTAEQVIQEKVIDPLKLRNTYFCGSYFMTTPYTSGYTLGDEGLLNTTNWNPSWGYTAGAMVSDLKDLKNWARYLADGALLSEAMQAERFDFGTNNYGLCMQSINYKDNLWVGHPGTIPGYNTQVWRNQSKKITLIINSNTDDDFPAMNLLIAYVILLGDL
jgi:D-alanyl-D-alanine carboxypeptidase